MSYCPKYRVNQNNELMTDSICVRCKYDVGDIDQNKVCCLCGRVGHDSKDCPILKEM